MQTHSNMLVCYNQEQLTNISKVQNIPQLLSQMDPEQKSRGEGGGINSNAS